MSGPMSVLPGSWRIAALCLLSSPALAAEPDLARPLIELAGRASQELGLALDQDAEALRVLESWRARARKACASSDPKGAAGGLSGLIFDGLEVVRQVEDRDPRFMLLPHVLIGRRGSCVGLVSLYLVLAQGVGLPACAVLAPGHLFVRAGPEGDRHNVELLRRGESMDDGWYLDTYGAPDGVSAYMRCLTAREFLAVVRYNVAVEYLARGRVEKAAPLWSQVVEDFTDFPEAHANLGLAHHLRGDLDPAREAYLEALRLHPGLPGLLHNLSLAILEASCFRPILELAAVLPGGPF